MSAQQCEADPSWPGRSGKTDSVLRLLRYIRERERTAAFAYDLADYCVELYLAGKLPRIAPDAPEETDG